MVVDSWLLAYLVFVSGLGLAVMIRVLFALKRAREKRRGRVEARVRFEAVPTEGPVDDPVGVAKRRAVKSIETHFTITRRVVVPMIATLTIAAMCLPFLSRVPAAFLSLAVAAATVLAGIASRPFIENAIAGLVISISKLINIGDTIRVGEIYGTVEDITATHTTVKIWDWRRHVVPNALMLQSTFINYSLFDKYLWASVEFWVSYDADLDDVKKIAVEAAKKSKYYAEHEAPEFWVMGLEKEGIRCWVAAWSDTPSDGWMLSHDIRSDMVVEFRRRGIWTHSHQHRLSPAPEAPNPLAAPAHPG